MKSLERRLQRNLAITLIIVMATIWMIGSLIPHSAYQQNKQMHNSNQEIIISSPQKKDRPARRFQWLFPILALAGVALILLIQGIVIRRTFRQLDHIQSEIKDLEAGKVIRLSEDVPTEIYPIIHEFNHLLSLMQERLERSRNSLGNLAHALKGPLNLLIQTLDQEPSLANNQQASDQAQRIHKLTERELKRARMAGLGNSSQRFNPKEELPILVDILAKVHGKPTECISLDIDADVTSFGDREDMLELLGNLLDNACKWAKTIVNCSISSNVDGICMVVEDDGKGQSEQKLEQMTNRGTRLDETVEGYGLGLSICKDIVKLYGGSINFGHSEQYGGLKVEVVIADKSH